MSRSALPIVRARSWAEIDRDALACVRRFYPSRLTEPGPIPIEHFIQFVLPKHFDVAFEVADLPHPSEGVTTPGNGVCRPMIFMESDVYERLIAGDRRARFTAAHESYHGIRHAEELQTALISGSHHGLHRKTEAIPPYRNPERQADVFASRMLMPAPAVDLATKYLGLNVRALADAFQVSQSAMSARLRELGLW